MIYHKPLNSDLIKTALYQLDWEELFLKYNPVIDKPISHNWTNIPTEEIFTPFGFNFFEDKKIKLRPHLRFFRCISNQSGSIHIDSDLYDCAFNFVVKGNGKMQWVSLEEPEFRDGNYTQSTNSKGSFKFAPKYKSLIVDEEWSGECALVRINSFHRVVCGDETRYCVSVRPSKEHFFKDIINLF